MIGSALGTAFNSDGARSTGRHFWGLAGDDIIDPLLGASIEPVADALGLEGFVPGVTGTEVTIFGIDLGFDMGLIITRTTKAGALHIASACLWNFKLADPETDPRSTSKS